MKPHTNIASHVEEGSGNVFADLGLANHERQQLKAYLTLQIYRLINQRGLTQTAADEILGIKQPHVSALMRNYSGSFSVEIWNDTSDSCSPSSRSCQPQEPKPSLP
jgi:predicted XRE-type DNA-binding protein